MLRRFCRVVAALVVAGALGAPAASSGHAVGISAGGCVMTGTLTATPDVSVVPKSGVIVNITAAGTCAQMRLIGSGSFSVGGQPIASCELSDGTLAGGFTVFPPVGTVPVVASYTGGPFTIHLVLDDATLRFVAVADFVWSGISADVTCLRSGVSTVPITGVVAYDE